jgi:hypothetical protein
MSAAVQTSLPSRVTIRWYQVVVMVLGLALIAATALAVYLAVNKPTAAAVPGTDSGTVAEQTCYRPHVPC